VWGRGEFGQESLVRCIDDRINNQSGLPLRRAQDHVSLQTSRLVRMSESSGPLASMPPGCTCNKAGKGRNDPVEVYGSTQATPRERSTGDEATEGTWRAGVEAGHLALYPVNLYGSLSGDVYTGEWAECARSKKRSASCQCETAP
jgi:hypothetical protein